MTAHFHAIVWIDHAEARIFHIGLTGDDEIVLHPHLPTRHLHHKAGSIGSGRVAPDEEFLAQVMQAVSDAGEVLIIGPSSAKTELASYVRGHDPKIGDRIAGVETADHPSDREIIAYARKHFRVQIPRAGTASTSAL